MQVFLLRTSKENWFFKGKEYDWSDLPEGFEVTFHGEHRWESDIESIKLKDVTVCYSCGKKVIEGLGRIISDGFFKSSDGNRFLIEKTTELKNPISRNEFLSIIDSEDSAGKLKVNQPTVTKLEPQQWERLKKIILRENPEVARDISILEEGEEFEDPRELAQES